MAVAGVIQMEVIRFTVEGVVNSFRKYETATFQNTELTPKKTHIAGMLTNIMGRSEGFYYSSLLPSIKIAVVPVSLNNIFTDLWQYKKWKKGNQGRDVVGRERLYRAQYQIFVFSPEELGEEILDALARPKRAPSLGQDDEMVIIRDAKRVKLTRVETRETVKIHSTFPKEAMNDCTFRMTLGYAGMIVPPRTVVAYMGYSRGPPRRPYDPLLITEFFGGFCEGNMSSQTEILTDGHVNVIPW